MYIIVPFVLPFIQEAMTSANYDRFAMAMSGEITQQLEKAVTKTVFNRVSFDIVFFKILILKLFILSLRP